MSVEERTLLMIFSAFRLAVPQAAFTQVFRAEWGPKAFNRPLVELDEHGFDEVVQRVIARGLIDVSNDSADAPHYTAHSLIRAHYARLLAEQSHAVKRAVHSAIASYCDRYSLFLESRNLQQFPGWRPSLAAARVIDGTQVQSLQLELVHHGCAAGMYDEAFAYMRNRIDRDDEKPLLFRGAYEILLSIAAEFFPNGDFSGEPLVGSVDAKTFLLSRAGTALTSLGRLDEAQNVYERSIELGLGDEHNASIDYRNLVSVYVDKGDLSEARRCATKSFEHAKRVVPLSGGSPDVLPSAPDVRTSIAWMGWIAHLQGELSRASEGFTVAEQMEQHIDPTAKFLYALRGVQHVSHLMRIGELEAARHRAAFNLEMCSNVGYMENVSLIQSQLARLSELDGNDGEALKHHNAAVQLARQISVQRVLIQTLTARGRFLGGEDGLSDLALALSYAVNGGYRLAEVDARIALARILLREQRDATEQARVEVQRAHNISFALSYHWGLVDCQEAVEKFALSERIAVM